MKYSYHYSLDICILMLNYQYGLIRESQPVVVSRYWEDRKAAKSSGAARRIAGAFFPSTRSTRIATLPVMQESEARAQIVEAGKRLRDRFFVASNDGNISARLAPNEILITPTSVNKGDVTLESILKIDLEGKVLSGSLKPSSETKMHLAVYRSRPDVAAIVHAHPPAATGFAACRIRLDQDVILPEVVFGLAKIGFAEYGTPTTEEIPNAVVKEIPDCDAMLLSNHGALTVGPDVMQAYYRMEVLEMYARVRLVTKILGEPKPLSESEVAELRKIRDAMGWGGKKKSSEEVPPELVSLIADAVVEVLRRRGGVT
jgi:L-fuculose-phosphate aldolase